MPSKAFAKHRAILLRGWWTAADGRMYHPTITALVLSMSARKDAEKKRKAEYRARMSHGTDKGQAGDSTGRDDTGTGTGTSKRDTENSPDAGGGAQDDPITAGFQPTQAGSVCKALRQAGIADVNPGHPRLLALLQAGAQPAEFTGFVHVAKSQRAPFAYLLGMVEGERTRAASMAGQLHRGAMPMTAKAAENAKWIKGTSLDRSTQDYIDAAPIAIR